MPEPVILEQQVEPGFSGQRLDQVAVELFPGYSRARLQQWIRNGALTVDGNEAKPSQRLAGGENLRIFAEPEADGEVAPQDLPLEVVYADQHILLINKPADFVVHPAAGNPDGTLQNALLHFDPDLAAIPRAGIVHRLDKDTTGIMVVARSLKAHANLISQLQERRMGRIYETVVHGTVAQGGTVDAPIGRNPHDRKRMAVVESGKPAVSHYRILDSYRHFTHLEVRLESGRTHQIRVHMQHIGQPLVGDALYGRKLQAGKDLPAAVTGAVKAFPRQALHARTLRLIHPDTLLEQEFHAPLPGDLSDLLAVLGREDRP